jgi:glycosyltransferase involved in cell wall biosynthesis
MIHLFINGYAASAGGGLTYLRNVIPQLARRPDVKTSVLLSSDLRAELGELSNIFFVPTSAPSSTLRRFFHEQTAIPALIRQSGAQVLISAGNFALWRSPIPQILLSRNSLYTSPDFVRDVRARGDYALWVDTLVKGWFARRSIGRAEITVAPSAAFAHDLTQWTGREVTTIHHGFDPLAFTRDQAPLPPETHVQLDAGKDALRLLFVSHYNYYRNFETLFRAVPFLNQHLQGKPLKLYLTCRLNSSDTSGTYRTDAASALITEVRDAHDIVELGAVPYRSLHHLYRACHVYVTPAYTETFAHPLVEAMSNGLPVVASDLPVHREICRDAAQYFPKFSPEELAESVFRVYKSPDLAASLSARGRQRAQDFSWEKHVDQLLQLAKSLAKVV